jgi:hypothetical protein
MSTVLQVLLVVFCLGLLAIIVQQIKTSRVIFSDFNYWIVFTLLLILMALFPNVVTRIAMFMQIETPVFAVFLIVIFLLILLVLSASFRISVLNRRFIQLTQKIALLEHDLERHEEVSERQQKEQKEMNK